MKNRTSELSSRELGPSCRRRKLPARAFTITCWKLTPLTTPRHRLWRGGLILGYIALSCIEVSPASAQQSSLFHQPAAPARAAMSGATVLAQANVADGGDYPHDLGQAQRQYQPPFLPPSSGNYLPPGNAAYGGTMAPPRTYQAPLPAKVLRVHDVVQIRVDESARMMAEGIAQQR